MTALTQPPETIRIKGGLDLAFEGAPHQALRAASPVNSVAISGHDFPGIRPKFSVATDEKVRAGQTLFVDRKRPSIAFTSPVSGSVTAINRTGHTFDSIVVQIDGDEAESFAVPKPLSPETFRQLLLKSGLWPAFLSRPFGRIPAADAVADALFVTAIDSNPMAPDPKIAMGLHADQFTAGLDALKLLTDGPVFVCHAPGTLPVSASGDRLRSVAITGRYPAGLAGTHIHHLMPAGIDRTVWQVGYQDVIAIGYLVSDGKPWCDRIISLAGSGVRHPALVTVKRGASLDDLLVGAMNDHPSQVMTGPALTGRESGYLGFYHNQVTVQEQAPHAGGILTRFRHFRRRKPGGAIIPNETFERAFPLDIPPVPLLRALCIADAETARDLGCLELLEEDVAVLTYLCSTGNDYGVLLRAVLDELVGDGR